MFGTLSLDHLIQCCPLAFYYFSESWTDDTWLFLQAFGIWLWQRSEACSRTSYGETNIIITKMKFDNF